MPNHLKQRWHAYYVYALFALALLYIMLVFLDRRAVGLIGFFVLLVLGIAGFRAELAFRRELEEYVATLSSRIKKVAEEAAFQMPLGIVLYNEDREIEWLNPYMEKLLGGERFLGMPLSGISEDLIPSLQGEAEEEIINIKDRKYRVQFRREERLLYFTDVTEYVQLKRAYEEEETVLGIIFLDNYEELTQGMDDQIRSNLNSRVTSILKQWATDNGIFLKRISSEKFVAVLHRSTLKTLEKNKFQILDKIREETGTESLPITLSIGIGVGRVALPELGQIAQSALDLALGRGGDQVAVKEMNGNVTFHGGKTNPVEKRTRVRARVISHALRELVLESDRVLVMGHANPDMDAIGSSIGILKVAEANDKKGYIVLDKQNKGAGIGRLLEEIEKNETLQEKLISPDQALELATEDTLLVVVDTHKPSMVIEPRLLDKMRRVVVIDHHRRGEDFVEDPVLVYMEPYASSTAELVTELLEYQPKRLKLGALEATALLAGITVDTKNFTLRTGSRTFDAASYLRAHGADTILVQRLLRDNLDEFIKRARLIQNTEIYRDGLAIARGHEEETYEQVMIAQAADTLLTMKGVKASFVISKRTDGKTSISARSLGDVNVQVIMENFGGGGHLTNAAAQFDDLSLDEAEDRLKQVIDDYLEGGESES